MFPLINTTALAEIVTAMALKPRKSLAPTAAR
jgi:hypothetical protein